MSRALDAAERRALASTPSRNRIQDGRFRKGPVPRDTSAQAQRRRAVLRWDGGRWVKVSHASVLRPGPCHRRRRKASSTVRHRRFTPALTSRSGDRRVRRFSQQGNEP